MNEVVEKDEKEAPPAWPSVDEIKPAEEGGPTARIGFNYQDEIAVSFLISMLEDSSVLKVHCETHDDILVVRAAGQTTRIAEFVQVKASGLEKLWSVADLCQRKKSKPGTSLLEKSLARDKHHEESRFRIVTLRPVVTELEILTLPCSALGRESNGERFIALEGEIEKRLPELKSPKGNGATFWLQNCLWDQRHDEAAVRTSNLVRVLRLSAQVGKPLLPEPAEILLDDLRAIAKAAGDAKWEPDRDKKIILREWLVKWWEAKIDELTKGASAASGGKLRMKMEAASLPAEVIDLAIDLRRRYAEQLRTSRYAESDEREHVLDRVKSEAQSLRARYVAGQLDLNGAAFHALCLDRMDVLNAERPTGAADQSAFLKGCLYDIADRCLLRFERPPQ